ncbi:NDR1/HIN1-like protein 13 isoform X1 [Mangifera indica]|uniref:NDR1/HIN1-like protein 13 isoform X1 n=1 Tax=Mangifera indica TaxID=29780 RepID=UPI001CFBD130|nr:NDR1/HIN1-like protein 13 isoform X1 [Mangifera indica]
MRQHTETNPYFLPPRSPTPTPTQKPQREHGGQQNQPLSPPPSSLHPQTQPTGIVPPLSHQQAETNFPWVWPLKKKGKPKHHDGRKDYQQQPLGPWVALASPQGSQDTQSTHSHGQEPVQPEHAQPTQPPKRQQRGRQHPQQEQPRQRPFVRQQPRRTKLPTWFLAVICAFFWLVIILGGLIVLIVYLVFRPHSPSFEVSNVSLNAAYLDVGSLLNADITVLAKFINTNKKVRVDFSYVVLDLYYGNTLIASQYIEPFTAARLQTRLASVHMVTSQVQLPLDETQRFQKEIERNEIVFQVKGVFRARSNLGSFLRYSYKLYGHCTIVVSNPPGGVLKGVKCKTKR